MSSKYKRVLLKLSGEALAQKATATADYSIINYDFLKKVCLTIKECVDEGVEMAIVVGGGNIWRGRQGGHDRVRSDHMGMLATVINALAIQDMLEEINVESRVLTAVEMKQFAEPHIRNKAISHLTKGKVIIYGCGTGNPYFSTDTAAALRAIEIHADVILLAKNIDGVYTADPKKDPDAKKLDELRYIDIIDKGLAVIDSTAASLCMENGLPLLVFDLNDPENIKRAIDGEKIGSIITLD